MKNNGLNSIHGIFAVVLAMLCLFFGGYILYPIFGETGGLLVGLLIGAVGAVFSVATKTKREEVFPLALPPVKQFFGSILMFIGVSFVGASISVFTSRIFDSQVRSDNIDALILNMSPALAILVVAVLPAICEEFFCRGFLVRAFSEIKNEKVVVFLVAIIFGGLHLDPYSFIPTALMGGILCYIAIKTRSLIIPILLHFANNALSVFLTFSMAQSSIQDADISSLSILQSVGMSLMYIAISVVPLYIGYRLFKGEKIFRFKSFVSVMVAVGILVTGTALLAFSSIKIVGFKTQTYEYDGDFSLEIPLQIEGEGTYTFSFVSENDDGIEVTLVCGENNIKNVTGADSVEMNADFEYQSGECKLVIRPSDPESVGKGTISYTYTLMKVDI